MSKKGDSGPPPPDPVAVSNAQSASNIASATAQQRLNMIGTSGPTGTTGYVADPNQPGGYTQTTTLSPQEQATYDLSKQAQNGALTTANTQLGRVNDALATPLTADGLPALTGGVQGGQIQNSFAGGAPVQYDVSGSPIQHDVGSSAPIQYDVSSGAPLQYSFNQGAGVQYGFNQGQRVQGQVGPADLTGANKQAQDAAYAQATSRLDPQFAQSENAERTRLVNQGLSENSDAYRNAMDTFNRGKTDAYSAAQNQAVTQGNTAEQQLFGEDLSKGQFANSAAAQQYTQNQGQAAFHNTAAAQDYGQNLGAAQFYNQTAGQDFGQNATAAQIHNAASAQDFGQQATSAQIHNAASAQDFGQNAAAAQLHNAASAQDFGQNQAQATFGNSAQAQDFQQGQQNAQLSDTARNQGLQERAYIQNQPINQFTGLLGLGQVGQPQGVQYTPSQVANTDVIGANALATQAAQANAARQAQASSGMMGGLFSLGSAALMASDVRLKTDRKLLHTRRDGVKVWSFRYRAGGPPQVGVMAQELRKIRPDLVIRRPDGMLAVNYAPLGAL